MLRECELNISGAGGQIDDQEIQVRPFHVIHQLLKSARDHGSSPDNGFLGLDEKSKTDDPQSILLKRHYGSFASDDGIAVLEPHHDVLAGGVGVGIKQAYPPSFGSLG